MGDHHRKSFFLLRDMTEIGTIRSEEDALFIVKALNLSFTERDKTLEKAAKIAETRLVNSEGEVYVVIKIAEEIRALKSTPMLDEVKRCKR